jgi:hypothetical protein
MKQQNLLRIVILLVLSIICLLLVGCGGSSSSGSTASASSPPPVTFTISFTATVLQGPEQGKALTGTLTLTKKADGSLTGTLTRTSGGLGTAGLTLPVTGQLHRYLIGLFLHLGPNQNLFGTGVIGSDPDQNKYVLGGTFSGPSETSTGTWAAEPGPGEMQAFGKAIGQD